MVDTVPRLALLTLANHPALLPTFDEHIAQLEFKNHDLVRLQERLLSLAGETLADEPGAIRKRLAGSPEASTLDLLGRDPLLTVHKFSRAAAADAVAASRLTHLLDRYSLAVSLDRELGEATAAAAKDTNDDTWAHLRSLTTAARKAREDLVSVLTEDAGANPL